MSEPVARRDLRLAHGEATRRRILEAAMDLASTEGLEALTIGRLATDLGMSKAGLFGHFGSKEALQLATLEAARAVFIEKVAAPAFAAPEGLPRLLALSAAWLAYAREGTFRGGCLFAGAAAEFDGREGPVRDRVAAILREWLEGLESAIRDAQRLGHLDTTIEPAQLAFELNALELGGNWAFQLFRDPGAMERAARAIQARLEALTPAPRGEPGRRSGREAGRGKSAPRALASKRGSG